MVVPTRFRIPMLRGQPIVRSALLDRLDRAIDEGVIVSVVAGAGYGKSTLLAQWAHRRVASQPIAWIAVDRLDHSPVERARALLGSINALYPDEDPVDVDRICQRIGGPQAEADAAIGEIEALMARREGPPLVWIWDDIHVIAQPVVWTWLDHFLDRMADLVRVVMIGRSRPLLPLAGRLARGELLEITEEDLRFDRDETARLLAQLPASALTTAEPTDGPSLEHLYRRTRGWVTGLKLLAAGVRGHDGEADRPELFDYLVEEVLEQLPPDLQQFLADVSVLDLITPAAAADVASIGVADADAHLDGLIQRNLFLTVHDAQRRVIRLHDLLRDCLQARLRRRDPSALVERHRRAARAQVDAGRGAFHWLAAGDLPAAMALLAQCPERLIKRGRIGLIEAALAGVPLDTPLATSGDVRFLQGWVALHGLAFERAAEHFEASSRSYRDEGDGDRSASAAIVAARTHTYSRTIDAAQRVLAGIDPAPLGPAARAEHDLESAWQAVAAGRSRQGGERLVEAARAIEAARSPDLLVRCIDRLRSHLLGAPGSVEAFERLHRATEAAGEAIDDVSRTHGRVAGAWAALWHGDVERADSLVSVPLAQLAAWAPIRTLFVDLSVTGALLAQARQDASHARALLEGLMVRDSAVASSVAAAWNTTYLWLIARQSWRAADPAGVSHAYARLLAGARGQRWPFLDIAATHIEGMLAELDGRAAEAIAKFGAVLSHAQRFPVLAVGGDPRVELATVHRRAGDPTAAWAQLESFLLEACDSGIVGPLFLEPVAWLMPFRALVPADHPRRAALLAILDHACRPRTGAGSCAAPAWHGPTSGDAAAPPTEAPPETPGRHPAAAPSAGRLARLSDREREVLWLIAEGASNKRIAQRLALSPHTVKRHVANILDKTDTHARGELIALALIDGGVPRRDPLPGTDPR
ncbi:MAG: LuxR C-terminal-related transcriptional regulator [Lautropia sp.]